MQTEGCHLSGFRMCFDSCIYEAHDITDLNFVSKFCLKFSFCFIIQP